MAGLIFNDVGRELRNEANAAQQSLTKIPPVGTLVYDIVW